MIEKKVMTSFYIEKDLKEDIKKQADVEKVSTSDLIRKVLKNYIDEVKSKKEW